jgi:hypothetical protein
MARIIAALWVALVLMACAQAPVEPEIRWEWRPIAEQGHDVDCRLMDVTLENSNNKRDCVGTPSPWWPAASKFGRVRGLRDCHMTTDILHGGSVQCEQPILCINHKGQVVEDHHCLEDIPMWTFKKPEEEQHGD